MIWLGIGFRKVALIESDNYNRRESAIVGGNHRNRYCEKCGKETILYKVFDGWSNGEDGQESYFYILKCPSAKGTSEWSALNFGHDCEGVN
jgi:hypothetical protein